MSKYYSDDFLSPLQVVVGPNEDLEKAIKRFSKKVKKDGILAEVKERRHYVKPSDKKKLQAKRAKFLRKNNNA